MRRTVRSGIAVVTLWSLVTAQGCGKPASPAQPQAQSLPSLEPQTQAPGAPITLSAPQRAGADATKHIVVLFMQNNSFNKLFGLWDQVNGDPVDNIAKAAPQNTIQIGQDGKPLGCLLINDVNLQPGSVTGPPACTGSIGDASYQSVFPNKPFLIDKVLPPGAVTCPPPGTDTSLARFAQVPADAGVPANSPGAQAGGCSRDLVHRFYQEQYQLNGGAMNRYAVGSDAAGLVMGYYDTRQLGTYKYLTGPGAPKYAVADKFFAGAFGGSFANGQWLISATLPQWPGAPDSVRSVIDENGMPKSAEATGPGHPYGQYNYYTSPMADGLKDGQMTQACGKPTTNPRTLCGDWLVNTSFSVQWPYPPGAVKDRLVPLLKYPTVGDRLNDAGVDWAWYSGGWSNANGLTDLPGWTNGTVGVPRSYLDPEGKPATNPSGCSDPTSDPTTTWPLCPDMDFQYHHQSFNYFYNWSQETTQTRENRARNLQDMAAWYPLVKGDTCGLKPVSFVQELGPRNQHPGYASAYVGDEQIAVALRSIYEGPCAADTLTIVTYDEFGGAWDHVPPPGQGPTTKGAHDEFGPGTRMPTLFVSNTLPRSGVDSTTYDLASVIGTITAKFNLQPVNRRDTEQATVWSAWSALQK
ncbi:MAG: alkaline phosphatase family protein [Mycobacteriaceae bacterium]